MGWGKASRGDQPCASLISCWPIHPYPPASHYLPPLQHTVSLGSVNLRWRDEVDVSVDSHSRLIVKLGRRSLRPGTTEPLVGGKLVYGRDGTVSITKPGLSVRVTQPLVHPKRGHAYFASYLTL